MTKPMTSREAFEKWARDEGYDLQTDNAIDDDSYSYMHVRSAWQAWQHQAQTIAELRAERESYVSTLKIADEFGLFRHSYIQDQPFGKRTVLKRLKNELAKLNPLTEKDT